MGSGGTVWQVLVGYKRGEVHGAIVNGVRTPTTPLLGIATNGSNALQGCFFGDTTTALLADVVVDCFIAGQTEMSDAELDRVMGWGMWRVGRQNDLPVGHPYRTTPPSPSTIYSPESRYIFNLNDWNNWLASIPVYKNVNKGGTPVAITGYETVFFDDFTSMTLQSDLTASADKNWFAPTVFSTIGAGAGLQNIATVPSSYIWDGTSAVTLRLLYTSTGWKTGAFASINKSGVGRTWKKGIFEIKCKFPLLPALNRPGFFPAFWAYDRQSLYWRTRNRLETDWFEYDGINGTFINFTQHVHGGTIDYSDPAGEIVHLTQMGLPSSKKIIGTPIDPADGYPTTIDIYDGNYHTWYVQIEDDFTYLVLDGIEIGRCVTSTELAADLFIIVDWAYSSPEHGAPGNQSLTYDMTIDYIKVRQKTTYLNSVPIGFSARPAITGVAAQNNTLPVIPNSVGSQMSYFWYHEDGTPIYTPSS